MSFLLCVGGPDGTHKPRLRFLIFNELPKSTFQGALKSALEILFLQLKGI